jgi:transcriptional regulator with XRE-family HTH domain
MTNTELRRLRRQLRLTQHELAEALGVRMMTVSRWETGLNPIPPLAVTALTLYAECHAAAPPGRPRRVSR